MSALEAAIARAEGGSALSRAEAADAMRDVLSGSSPDASIARLLLLLAERGETDGELEGMLDAMMERCVRAEPAPEGAIDVCGTGGDGARTFNVSTAAAFVAAAAGATVAKHGNRSSSGGTGSADMLEALGVDLGATRGGAASAAAGCGVGFMFAPAFHPAMKAAAAARRALAGTRTALNLLGPLANPALVRRQLVGVSSEAHLGRLPEMLARRGSEFAMAVRSANGLDELSTCSGGEAVIVRRAGGQGRECPDGPPRALTARIAVRPGELGLRASRISEIVPGGQREALRMMVGAIDGTAGRAAVETAALNAGAALVVAGIAGSIGDGLRAALEATESGRASRRLDAFVAAHGDPELLEGARRR
ncbi:MAG: anthranilate phosphoribosyltransferase [Thaumarchaeota archaeon]|nr:anthranilate phosphoribosyltransferase [Nitrososphaerota archaeon]